MEIDNFPVLNCHLFIFKCICWSPFCVENMPCYSLPFASVLCQWSPPVHFCLSQSMVSSSYSLFGLHGSSSFPNVACLGNVLLTIHKYCKHIQRNGVYLPVLAVLCSICSLLFFALWCSWSSYRSSQGLSVPSHLKSVLGFAFTTMFHLHIVEYWIYKFLWFSLLVTLSFICVLLVSSLLTEL